MARRRQGLLLPWEHRGEVLRDLVSRPRWGVVALFVALLGSGYVLFRVAEHRRRERETYVTLAEAHRAVELFRSEMGRCPRNAQELLDPPRGAARYLREPPRDGWGRELRLRCALDTDQPVQVVSAGPSGSFLLDDNYY